MKKELFLEIANLYKKEKDVKRLVYRLIKGAYKEYPGNKEKWLSLEELQNISEKIMKTNEEIQAEKNRIHIEKENFLQEKINLLKAKGYFDIRVLNNDYISYKKEKIREYEYVKYFKDELNEIETSYFYEMKSEIELIVEYLLYNKYIKGYIVSIKNPHFKRSKPIKVTKYKAVK